MKLFWFYLTAQEYQFILYALSLIPEITLGGVTTEKLMEVLKKEITKDSQDAITLEWRGKE